MQRYIVATGRAGSTELFGRPKRLLWARLGSLGGSVLTGEIASSEKSEWSKLEQRLAGLARQIPTRKPRPQEVAQVREQHPTYDHPRVGHRRRPRVCRR